MSKYMDTFHAHYWMCKKWFNGIENHSSEDMSLFFSWLYFEACICDGVQSIHHLMRTTHYVVSGESRLATFIRWWWGICQTPRVQYSIRLRGIVRLQTSESNHFLLKKALNPAHGGYQDSVSDSVTGWLCAEACMNWWWIPLRNPC